MQINDALEHARSIPGRLSLAPAFTIASYLVLSLYDFLSLKYGWKRLSASTIVMTSFVNALCVLAFAKAWAPCSG